MTPTFTTPPEGHICAHRPHGPAVPGVMLVRRGQRSIRNGSGRVQKFVCPLCGGSVSGGPQAYLRKLHRPDVARQVYREVATGQPLTDIAQHADTRLATVLRHMEVLAQAAKHYHQVRRPAPKAAGYALVEMPISIVGTSQRSLLAAISRDKRPRLLTFYWVNARTRDKVHASLVADFGQPHAVQDEWERWLTGRLGATVSYSKSWETVEQRLWIVLARTNGWRLA